MNEWIKKSISLAKSNFYLDKLLEVYPPDEISRGKIVEEASPALRQLFQNRDSVNLVKELIRLKKKGFKFPIEHPYISFLSHYEDAIYKNPETIRKICDKLFEMNYEELKERLEAPKKPSRRIGPMFRRWLKNKFNFLVLEKFKKSRGLSFLEGGDTLLKNYAKNELKCQFTKLSKGLDFIVKSNDKYLIGTAKFITDFGGSQDNQFMEAIRLIKETKCPPNIIKVAVVDGVAYLGGKMKSTLQELKNNEFCFSALLLDEFIKKYLLV